MKTLLVALLVFLPATSFAQNAGRPNRPNQALAPATVRTKAAAPKPLSENVTINLKGWLHGELELNLDLTGSGPEFRLETIGPAGKDDSTPRAILTIQAIVEKAGDGYRVEYTFGGRFAIISATQNRGTDKPVTHSFEFRDLVVDGSVLLKPGKPVALSNIHGKKLHITVSKAE